MAIKQTPIESSITLFATGADPVIISWKVIPGLLPTLGIAGSSSPADTSAPPATASVPNRTYGVPIEAMDATCKASEYLQEIMLEFDIISINNKMIAIKFTSIVSKKCSPLSTFSIWYILLIIIVCIALAVMTAYIYKHRSSIKITLNL